MLDARLVKITGSGDPFGSKHFRTVLKRLNHTEFPNLRIELQTNGQLLDALAWEQLSLADIVDSVWISIDAARSETYSRLRRGGDFERLKRNLEFVADLRQRNIICTFRLDTVVQLDNLDELGDIVDLGRQLRADIIGFQRIRNWGTFDSETFCGIDVGSFLHPRFKDLQDLLNCPKFDGDDIDLGNHGALR
jgi:molybdenum cofactor biosynthesis enzyme MoaA